MRGAAAVQRKEGRGDGDRNRYGPHERIRKPARADRYELLGAARAGHQQTIAQVDTALQAESCRSTCMGWTRRAVVVNADGRTAEVGR